MIVTAAVPGSDLDEAAPGGLALNPCVLVVDDEFLIAIGICMQVEDMGHRVCGTAATADEAVTMAEAHRPAVVLMGLRLQSVDDGVQAANLIHQRVGSKVIFITASRDPAALARIASDHPADILFKPVSGRRLHAAIDAALAGPP